MSRSRLRYSPTHEWVEVDAAGHGTVGLTRRGLEWLGPVLGVRLPPVGARLRLGGPAGTLVGARGELTVYSPLTGTVESHNLQLEGSPGLVGDDPERAGWLFRLALAAPRELEVLHDERDYLRLLSRMDQD